MTELTWDELSKHQRNVRDRSILSLFEDGQRASAFSARLDDMFFDYSKTNIDETAMGLLLDLAKSADVEARRDAMFAGEKINETEGRAVLHTALRNPDTPVIVDGMDVSMGVRDTIGRMANFANLIRDSKITDIVNIGIGGSDLGPAMAPLALAPYVDGPRCHFVSNVDGAHVADTLKHLDATRTLVIVASKTFTTIETMTNASTARDWMVKGGGDPAAQFCALSSNLEKTAESA